jgi:beta-alanine--pyruvate transaminase
MPFTANRHFKANPRLLARAKGMYYWTADGREVLDGVAGLWCVNAGHCRAEIADAVAQQLNTMEFAPTFQMGHPIAFELASRLAQLAPPSMDRVFFTNSGSESVDTALKIALAYHRARGQGQKTRFIGREKGYHGVGFGGMSVGGMVNNRKTFSTAMIAGVDHLPHTLDIAHNAFSRGLPHWGAHLANELERDPAAGGLPEAAARDLRQTRYFADFRRSHHGIRAYRPAVRRPGLRRDAGPDDHGEGLDQRGHSDGRGIRATQDL